MLLALTPGDPLQAQRDVAELEGLVRSAGGEPVGLVQQRRQQVSPRRCGGGQGAGGGPGGPPGGGHPGGH
ncbi:hypothetical protein [Cyanobium sp. ATX-6F1]|uniref:hypothetical protein n=1 Tax=Cyanobium sp. ATX-6F1 TaxID=3137388 RepID=UPI0039BE29CB